MPETDSIISGDTIMETETDSCTSASEAESESESGSEYVPSHRITRWAPRNGAGARNEPGVNSGTHWTDTDLTILQDLLVHHASVDRIAATLGRTPKAVMHAMRKLFFQQMVSHSPDHVAAFYGVNKDALMSFLVHDKYDKPLHYFERFRVRPSTGFDRLVGTTTFLLLFSAIGWYINIVANSPFNSTCSKV